MISAQKKELRNKILRKRGYFYSFDDAAQASHIIIEKLKNDPAYQQAETIMCFVSFGTEVHTHDFIQQALAEGKRILVPFIRSKKDGMLTSELKDFSELELGYFNILSPKPEYLRLTEEDPDLVIMPAVAFCKNGFRIGYGGGFYDRYLARLTKRVPRIGIGFDVQVVDEVPVEEFDQPIDKLITEKAIYNF